MTKPSTTTQETRELEPRLLPCPFCGSDAELVEWAGSYAAICTNTECRADIGNDYGLEEERVIHLWNTRASDTEQVIRLREALEAILIEAEFVGDAKQPFSTWIAERCRAALQPKAETEAKCH